MCSYTVPQSLIKEVPVWLDTHLVLILNIKRHFSCKLYLQKFIKMEDNLFDYSFTKKDTEMNNKFVFLMKNYHKGLEMWLPW
jgi:hypothetical protein